MSFSSPFDNIFNFQLGKILLATASGPQLEAMMAKDWPYFNHYSEEIDQCLSGASCQGVTEHLISLGSLYNYHL